MADDDKGAKDENLEDDDLAAVDKLQAAYKEIRAELGKVIVGQEEVLEQLLICIFSQSRPGSPSDRLCQVR